MVFTAILTVIPVEVQQRVARQDFLEEEVTSEVILDFHLCLDKIHTPDIPVYIQAVNRQAEKVC